MKENNTSNDKLEAKLKYTRRGFIGAGLILATATYSKYLGDYLKQTGDIMNYLIDSGININYNFHKVYFLLTEKNKIIKDLDKLSSEHQINPEILLAYKKAYGENNKYSKILDKMSIDYDAFAGEINKHLTKFSNPLTDITSQIYGNLYNTAQKSLDRNVNSEFYIHDYNLVMERKKDILDRQQNIELKIRSAIASKKNNNFDFFTRFSNDNVEEVMKDYITAGLENKLLIKIVNEKGIGGRLNQDLFQIDKELEELLGEKGYKRYKDVKYHKNRKVDWSTVLYYGGAVITINLFYNPLKIISKINESIIKKVYSNKISRRKFLGINN
jgi:predicted nucleotidyltransferase